MRGDRYKSDYSGTNRGAQVPWNQVGDLLRFRLTAMAEVAAE